MTETTNKPIVIFKGDDTDAFNLRTIKIKIGGSIDLSEASARFTLCGWEVKWGKKDLQNGELDLVLTSHVTSEFPLGLAYGKLCLFDDNASKLTVSTTIPFLITNKIQEETNEEYSVTVNLSGNTDVNITFAVPNLEKPKWKSDEDITLIEPVNDDATVSIGNIHLKKLENVSFIPDRYSLTDIKNLVNTLLGVLKGNK